MADMLKILIVDDLQVNLVLMEHLLKGADREIYTADNGAEAVEIFSKHDFSLVILDIQMPDMDGYQIAKAIKELDQGRDIPIIFITAIFQDQEYVKKGYAVGAVDYLFRPIDAHLLRSKVDVFLELYSQRLQLEHEIAERKKTEEALKLAESRYRNIFERAVEGIFRAKMDGTIVEANPACVDILGYASAEELSSIPRLAAEMMIQPNERERYLSGMEAEGFVSHYEYQARRKSGDVVWLSESSRLIRGEEGEERFIEGVLLDVTERKKSEQDLQYKANYDGLTDIPNRHLFFDRLDNCLASARRYGDSLAVLFLDLDEFKAVNDTYGHQAGDKVLAEVARRLKKRVRSSDTLARIGGDEFGILLPKIDAPGSAAGVAEDLLKALDDPIVVAGKEFRIQATIGLSLFPEDSEDSVGLVSRADTAMYSAKKKGVGKYAFYSGIHR